MVNTSADFGWGGQPTSSRYSIAGVCRYRVLRHGENSPRYLPIQTVLCIRLLVYLSVIKLVNVHLAYRRPTQLLGSNFWHGGNKIC